jgi:hypothetical protein
MADISLIDPYSAKQESIARQRRMAQALQQQAQTPLEMPQSPGVLISPYAGLAKVLQGVYGGYQEAEADKEYRALAEEARTNQATDFANVIRALSAPGREGVKGQDFVADTPAVMASKIEKGFGGYGMPQEVGQYEMTPAVPGQPAIARQEPIAPGYISPELIASLKDPSMRQFAMAQVMAKLEPKAPISVAPGGTLLDPHTFKPVFTANAAPQRPVALSEGQNLYDSNGKLLVTGTAKTETAALSTLGKLQAERAAIAKTNPKDPRLIELNAAIANETRNVAADRLEWDKKVQDAKDKAPNYTYKEEVDPTTNIKSLIKIDNKGVASEVLNSAGAKVKTDLPPKQNPVAVKTTINGQNVTIYVDPSTLAGKQYPEQYTGIIKDLLEAQDLMKYQTDPRVIALVGSALNKGAGLPTQEDVARYLLDFDKTKVEMAYNNLKLNVGPSLKEAPNVLTGQYPSGSNAPAPAANGTKAAALPLPPDKDKNKLINGQTYQTISGPARWDAATGQFVQ